jgi:UDP-N-acetylglucosamine--N-acetylmuramyl-(pentapeptide) pyrophosphoryl-undecaprenol N-acetylglucosamine transferase
MKKEMKSHNVIFCGGGTGGHIFPAIAIANRLKLQIPESNILFIGALGKMEMHRVPEAGYPIKGLPIQGLLRQLSLKNILVIFKAIKSYFMAKQLLKKFDTDWVVGTGGFASLPVGLAAAHLGIPLFIWEGNGYAGLSNKILNKSARRIYCGFNEMESHFPHNNWVHSGNPIREEILKDIPQEESLKYFGFNQKATTLFITGGSLGAKSINLAVEQYVGDWLDAGICVIWQTGSSFQTNIRHPLLWSAPFLGEMIHAYNLADVVISRSGALSVSEIMARGIPAIFVPSPNVTDDHQTKNAEKACKSGGAILIKDEQLYTDLGSCVSSLIFAPAKLSEMSIALLSEAKPKATEFILDDILKNL